MFYWIQLLPREAEAALSYTVKTEERRQTGSKTEKQISGGGDGGESKRHTHYTKGGVEIQVCPGDNHLSP